MEFLPNLEQEDPGLEPEAPRKTGFPRFWEILSRDFWNVFRAGVLALLGCAPFFAGIAFALYSHVLIFAPLFGLLGGALAGPELCGLADTVLRALRDEPGFWWHIYRRAWKRNAKAALLPGAVGGTLLALQIFLLFHAGTLELDTITGAALAAGIFLTLGLSLYVWPQLALMELPFCAMLKNAVLLFAGQLPRSLAALAIMAGYWGVVLRFFMLAVTLVPFTNFWLPTLPAMFLIYPGIERSFHIEEKIRDLEKARRRNQPTLFRQ